jgi:hypothetical protein
VIVAVWDWRPGSLTATHPGLHGNLRGGGRDDRPLEPMARGLETVARATPELAASIQIIEQRHLVQGGGHLERGLQRDLILTELGQGRGHIHILDI